MHVCPGFRRIIISMLRLLSRIIIFAIHCDRGPDKHNIYNVYNALQQLYNNGLESLTFIISYFFGPIIDIVRVYNIYLIYITM